MQPTYSEDGSLFAWGSGQEGALGLGSKTDHETPKLVGALTGKRVTQVSAGHGFSLILTDEGQVPLHLLCNILTS